MTAPTPRNGATSPHRNTLAEALRHISQALALLADELGEQPAPQTPRALDSRRLLSIAEAAERLAVSERTLRRQVARGEVAHKKIGSRVLIPSTAVEQMADDADGAL